MFIAAPNQIANTSQELRAALESVRLEVIATAKATLAQVQADNPGMREPVTIVDGKKNRPPESMRLFGEGITFMAPVAAAKEAVHFAELYVRAAVLNVFKHPSGFYASHFTWYVNGDEQGAGEPDISKMGARGNAQLVNTAGYAAMPEIFVPGGVLFACYKFLRQKFGNRISVSFRYAPAAAFVSDWPLRRGARGARRYALPVLTIGQPAATFEVGARTPGVNRRGKARRTARKYASVDGNAKYLPRRRS